MNRTFSIGQLVATRGVHDLMQDDPGFNDFAQTCFLKYRRCDWGDTEGGQSPTSARGQPEGLRRRVPGEVQSTLTGDTRESDKAQNDRAVAHGDDRILAEYRHPDHPEWRLWIITEWDRRVTTLLFPDEY